MSVCLPFCPLGSILESPCLSVVLSISYVVYWNHHVCPSVRLSISVCVCGGGGGTGITVSVLLSISVCVGGGEFTGITVSVCPSILHGLVQKIFSESLNGL